MGYSYWVHSHYQLLHSIIMSIQQQLISEISRQPEPLLLEVWHYLKFLESKSELKLPADQPALRSGYGSVPGIIMADDFDAPLPEFAEYRP